ncbi:MAG: hypothetical protein AAGA48_29110 [Myxococcota bacterium]
MSRWFLALAMGCSPIAGDWEAESASSEAGNSIAIGILEVDLDGETLLEIDASGDGPTGSLRATGSADLGESTLSLLGSLDGTTVDVQGPCTRDGRELLCDLEVGEASWELDFRRD